MPLRALLLDNLSWKMLSLGLAVLIWYGAHVFMHDDIRPIVRPLQPLGTRDFHDLPIRFLSADPRSHSVRVEPPSVLVRVGGELALLERLTEQDPLVFVEVPHDFNYETVTNRVEVRLPPSVRLLNVIPERVRITPVGLPSP